MHRRVKGSFRVGRGGSCKDQRADQGAGSGAQWLCLTMFERAFEVVRAGIYVPGAADAGQRSGRLLQRRTYSRCSALDGQMGGSCCAAT
jgi:hypothetical protein